MCANPAVASALPAWLAALGGCCRGEAGAHEADGDLPAACAEDAPIVRSERIDFFRRSRQQDAVATRSPDGYAMVRFNSHVSMRYHSVRSGSESANTEDFANAAGGGSGLCTRQGEPTTASPELSDEGSCLSSASSALDSHDAAVFAAVEEACRQRRSPRAPTLGPMVERDLRSHWTSVEDSSSSAQASVSPPVPVSSSRADPPLPSGGPAAATAAPAPPHQEGGAVVTQTSSGPATAGMRGAGSTTPSHRASLATSPSRKRQPSVSPPGSGRGQAQEGTEARYGVGDKVEVRDKKTDEWKLGIVSGVSPLQVRPFSWKLGVEWRFVRPRAPEPGIIRSRANSPALQKLARSRTAELAERVAEASPPAFARSRTAELVEPAGALCSPTTDAKSRATATAFSRTQTLDSVPSTAASSGGTGKDNVAWRSAGVSARSRSGSISTLGEDDDPSSPWNFRSLLAGVGFRGVGDTDPFSANNAVIIFDWDDTLFPTWYLTHFGAQDGATITADFAVHGRAVLDILLAARDVARVAIVTLATKEWVETKCDMIIPVAEFFKELKSLGINIYYASNKAEASTDGSRVASKKQAMSQCLRRMYGLRKVRWNVLSIGDSDVEQRALRELLGEHSQTRGSLCKTLKFPSDPTVEQLTASLRSLKKQIPRMVAHKRDFDQTTSSMYMSF